MTTWQVVRLKNLCIDAGQYGIGIASDSYVDSGTRLLRTTDISSGSLTPAEQGVFVADPPSERYTLRAGDLLLSRSGTPPGQSYLVRASDQGATFAGYLVRFRPRHEVDPKFLSYIARSTPFQHTIHSESVASTIQNFNAERYANIEFRVPGYSEQCRIAEFLDTEIARIDRLKQLDTKLLALLTERRQAIIDHVVDTSSTSLVKLFWRLNLLRDGTHQPPPRVATGVPLLTARNVASGSVTLTNMDTHVSEKDATLLEKSILLTPGDVLLSVKGTVGASAVTPPSFPRAVLDRNVALLRPRGYSSEWLNYVLSSTSLQQQMRLSVTAVAQPGLPLGAIRELRVPDATSHVQVAGVSRISTTCSEIDRIVARVQRKDAVLHERRQALITAAVTGQFDVSTASGRNVTDGVPTS
ncbi:restriction endonuclease subunit S [[Kitasatospora] papulosa]|uniref:restriction endonuclease subunit S n=1 Tax=Streptomyces TaxID=1883 RepID=UPI0025B582AA|nr:restriction endonuclease subunit S [Streptomyces sp. P9-2B-1]WJY34656.1 restriction endonuclease subunit S [Streptomyces sp. P9-2B-1]